VPDKVTSEALIKYMTAKFSRQNNRCNCAAKGRRCVTTLRRAQAWALWELQQVGGVIGSIGVGHGKTLLGLLAPMALKVPTTRVVVLLCPPSNVGEIISDYELMSNHFNLTSITVHGRQNYTRRVPGTPALHVMPYSMLSRPESTAWITSVSPYAIIADEIDKLRNPDTATTGRVLRQFAVNPQTKFAGWTGSLMDKSIGDFAHLLALALGDTSPLPLEPVVVKDWARALDPGEYPAPGGSLMRFCRPGESLEQGMSRRLRETAGFITTEEAAVSTPLVVTEKAAPPVPTDVEQALLQLRHTMQRPDGEELVDGLAVAKCARELACGFYYRWIYPKGEPEALITEWFEKRKAWHKELRGFLIQRREHLDSEKLATDAARRYWGDMDCEGPQWQAQHWPAWRDIADKVDPSTQAVRLNDYLVRDAAEWALQNRGIVWYGHREVGLWIAQLSGLNMHEGGANARERILSETGNKSIIASIKSHGRGRDGLQYRFRDQLIASPPASPTAWEQLLGRLHRTGQEAESIRALYYAHTKELRAAVLGALTKAGTVQGLLGQSQKLLK
jgi:hypothetical protein